jgi:GAF domain-containing protein
VQDISALQEINEAILQKGLDEVTQLIAEKAIALTEANYATLRLVDESGGFLKLKAVSGRDSKEDALPIDENSFSGWVAMAGKAALCPDVKKDDHYVEWYPDVKSCMAVPLKREDQVVGTLYVESTRPGAFSEQYQLDLLQALANQASIAIDNARLYGQRAEDIAALQEINEAVISKERDEILQLVVEKAVEVMPGEYGELWLQDPATGDLVLQAVCGPGAAKEAALEIGRLKAGEASTNIRVAKTGQPCIWEYEEEKDTDWTGTAGCWTVFRTKPLLPLKTPGFSRRWMKEPHNSSSFRKSRPLSLVNQPTLIRFCV